MNRNESSGQQRPLFSFETLQVLGLKRVVLYKHRLAKVESVE